MTESRYTHVICGQCAQWHPIGPCPAPPAMTDDELARALLETLTRRPNGFHDGLQVSEERAIQLIVAYGREERRRVWEEVARKITEEDSLFMEYTDESLTNIIFNLEKFADWCRQQAREEETR